MLLVFTNFNGNTTGGGDTGAWQGTFYGNTGIATGIANDDYPEAVLGEFTGHFANDGHVAGAFGADKKLTNLLSRSMVKSHGPLVLFRFKEVSWGIYSMVIKRLKGLAIPRATVMRLN